MSILKSILHRWDKDSKSYDTLHPETEVAQITDFADGIVSKLAATTAISAISALQTDSWFGQLLKLVLNASGVKYNIDVNGYVCLGSFFGGLIIQWGLSHAEQTIPFNIVFATKAFIVLSSQANARYSPATVGVDQTDVSQSGFLGYAADDQDNHYQDALWWLAIGH